MDASCWKAMNLHRRQCELSLASFPSLTAARRIVSCSRGLIVVLPCVGATAGREDVKRPENVGNENTRGIIKGL